MLHRVAAALLVPVAAYAGGGPAHVMVLYDGPDPEAAAIAEHYADARDLATDHLCALAGPFDDDIALDDFFDDVEQPMVACLHALADPDDIDVLVTVRGLPRRVVLPDDGYFTSLEAMLQVHDARGPYGDPVAGSAHDTTGLWHATVPNPAFLDGDCVPDQLALPDLYDGLYDGSCAFDQRISLPSGFRRSREWTTSVYDFSGNLFVVGRLDGFDAEDAHALVDRGVAADGAFPDAELLCMAGADLALSARDAECELATRRLAAAGLDGVWEPTHYSNLSGHTVVGMFTGGPYLLDAVEGQTYAPGAIVDNLTAYGAVPDNFHCDASGDVCPETELQTSIARFVRAGATGVHGTVAQPSNGAFPHADAMLFYASGYSLGESFLFAQRHLYWQNVVLGDPLATPFAVRPEVSVDGEWVARSDVLEVTATHPDGVAELVLYVDGERVASDGGDALSWTVTSDVGTHDALAVAVAADRTVDRPGWTVANQVLRPETQGWTRFRLVVSPGPDTRLARGRCGCGHGSGGDASLVVLALAMAVLRRRGASVGRQGTGQSHAEPVSQVRSCATGFGSQSPSASSWTSDIGSFRPTSASSA